MSFLKSFVGGGLVVVGSTIWQLVKAERATEFTVTVTSWECSSCGYRLPVRRLSCRLRRHVVVKTMAEYRPGS